MTVATDEATRRVAVETLDSMVLQAPAGSGKTGVLVQRMLVLLAQVERPEQVLAITFTRKATAEMRERVIDALRRADAGDNIEPPADEYKRRTVELAGHVLAHSRQLGWNLLEQPSRLRIQTIDALNRWIATQLPASAPHAAGVVVEQPRQLYLDAARRALSDAGELTGDESALGNLLRLANNRWSQLEQDLAVLLANRNRWLRFLDARRPDALIEVIESTLRDVIRARLAAARNWFGSDILQRVAPILADTARERGVKGDTDLDWQAWSTTHAGLGDDAHDVRRWRLLGRFFLDSKGERLLSVFQTRNGMPRVAEARRADAKELLEELSRRDTALTELQALARLPAASLATAHRDRLTALARFLPIAAAVLTAEMAQRGVTDLVEVSGAARAALDAASQPTDLALRLGESIRHVLVDEFQDTSIDQFDRLAHLTRGWQDRDGRSLFLVGDPMQSIYRFRDAEVELFLRAQHRGIGSIHLQASRITNNFRSGPRIVDFVNDRFSRLLPQTDDLRTGRAAFRPAVAAATDSGVGTVRCHLLASGMGVDARLLEAERIAAIVADLRRRDTSAEIAVLTQTRPQVHGLIEYLSARGFAARGVRMVPLGELPAIVDLSALTRALLDPMDRIAWLAILRAPWCAATLNCLEAVARRAGDGPLLGALLDRDWMDAVVDSPRLRATVDVLQAAVAAVATDGLAATVERCWRLLGGPACLAVGGSLADAERFLDRLTELAAGPEWRGASSLTRMIDELYAEAGGDTKLDVLTIHETKGLEFQHVIVAGLGQPLRGDSRQLIDWVEAAVGDGPDTGLLLGARPEPNTSVDDGVFNWIREEQRRRQAEERIRLMYVAATRARESLDWVACLERDAAGHWRQPPRNTALRVLWPALEADFLASTELSKASNTTAIAPSRSSGQRVAGVRPLMRLPATWQLPVPPTLLDTQLRAPAHIDFAAEPEFEWAGIEARHLGTVLHASLQRLAEQARALGRLPDGIDADPFWSRELRALGFDAAHIASAVAVIERAMAATLRDPRGRWLLDPSHPQSWCEQTLTGVIDNQIVAAVVDRHFVDRDGRRWVVDYKSSRHEGGDLRGFLDNERRRYAPQIERYRTLLAARFQDSRPLHAALYFPLLQEIVYYQDGT